jgi:hypothetical protein
MIAVTVQSNATIKSDHPHHLRVANREGTSAFPDSATIETKCDQVGVYYAGADVP